MRLKDRSALVTGAGRGIGVEVCRQLGKEGARVLLGVRTIAKIKEFQKQLADEGIANEAVELDVSSIDSIEKFLNLQTDVDVLINNAALLDHERNLMSVSNAAVDEILRTNLLGPTILAKELAAKMRKKKWGRIVNVSSGMGSINRGLGADSPVYRISKVALNGMTISLAQALDGSGVLVNSVDPGWVRTDMGGHSATRSTEQGARSIVWAALIPDDGPTGGFFYDGKPATW